MPLFKKQKSDLSHVLFEVTNACNLQCSYCYNHWKNIKRNIQPVNYNLADKTLKKLFKSANIQHVTFTGGEPFMAERFQELIMFCRMKGANVNLITNGTLGKADDYAQLIRLGVQLFELPFHSYDKATHDKMTNHEGSWSKSKDTIQLIHRLGGYVVPVIVITKHNYAHVGKTLSTLYNIGFHRVMLNRYNIGGENAHQPELITADKAQLNEAFSQANQVATAKKMQVTSNVCTPHCLVDPQKYPAIASTNCSATIANRPITFSATGDVRFCNHSPQVLGNIHKTNLKEILKSAQKTGSIEKRPVYCTDCSVYEKCMGGCRAASQQKGFSLEEVDPIVMLNEDKNANSA